MNSIIESIDEKDFKNLKFYFSEVFDLVEFLYFDNKESCWKVTDNSWKITNNSESKNYDLMKMIKEHDLMKQLLDFLPKDHDYEVMFQIPELHKEEIYPHIESDKYEIRILSEQIKGSIIEPSFNIDEHIKEIVDIESKEQLNKILTDLDCIGSGLRGISIYDYENGTIYDVESPSNYYKEEVLNNSGDNAVFELIKMQQATIFTDMYPTFKPIFHEVQNVVLKKLYNYLIDAMDIKKETSQHIETIRKMPESIIKWFSESMEFMSESGLSKSIILWRTMIKLDVKFDDIKVASDLI